MEKILKRVIFALLFVIGFFQNNLLFSQVRSLKLGIGPSLYMNTLFPDNASKKLTLGGGLDVLYSAFPNFSLGTSFGYLELGGTRDEYAFRTSSWRFNMNLIYNTLPYSEINPFLYSGVGILYYDPKYEDGKPLPNSIIGQYQKWSLTIPFGVGANIFFAEEFAFLFAIEYNIAMSDYIDDIKKGGGDNFISIRFGINYFFFDKFYILRERKNKL